MKIPFFTKKQKDDQKGMKVEDKEEQFHASLDRLVDSGMEKTKKWVSLWSDSLKYFFGDQLRGFKKRKGWDDVILNYIWPSTMQEIAKLTKNHPKIFANAWEESDSDVAESWQSYLQWQWENGVNGHGMRKEQMLNILDCKIFGVSISKWYWEDKCYWDDDKKVWYGDIKHKLWHPAFFWADDDECIYNGNCGTERFATLDWGIHRWPEYEKELTAEAKSFKEVSSAWSDFAIQGSMEAVVSGSTGTGSSDKAEDIYRGNLLLNRVLDSEKSSANSENAVNNDTKIIKIQEIYLKDYEETEIVDEQDMPEEEAIASGKIFKIENIHYDTSTNKPVEPNDWPKSEIKRYKQPVFPNGRYILRVGHTILNPEIEQQVWSYRKWPFIVKPHYFLPHMWQGVDCVQMYKSIQDMINITASHLYNNLKQFGDPKIAVETGAIASPPGSSSQHYKIGSGAGAIIRLVKGGLSRFKILDPPNLSQEAVFLYQMFTQEYKNIQGLQSISKGEKLPGKITATEASMLAVSSVDRIALQSAMEDIWIKESCQMIAEIAQKNIEPERMVRIIGEDRIPGVMQITSKEKDVKFDIDIVPGLTLPFDEEKRIEKYMTAYKLMADPNPNPMLPDMLRILEIQNWKKLIAQIEPYQLYMQFSQLYEAVKAGQVDPNEAIQLIVQKATQLYMQQQANPLTRQTDGKENKTGSQQKAGPSTANKG